MFAAQANERDIEKENRNPPRKDLKIRIRYRKQPEEDCFHHLHLSADQSAALVQQRLTLRELIDQIQEAAPSPISNVNAVYLWNFTTGMYEQAREVQPLGPAFWQTDLIDLIFVWKPSPTLDRTGSGQSDLAEVKSQLQEIKELMREMLKVPSFQNPHPELRRQIVRNFGADSIKTISNLGSHAASREDLDFAFLYSNPLVARTAQGGMSSLSEPVNFCGECNEIIKVVEDKKKRFNVEIECASQNEFLKVLRRKPKILHIMCHGSVDCKNACSVYFLEFEGENGELECLTPDLLRSQISRLDLSDIQLVFLNACHSEVKSANPGNRQGVLGVRREGADHREVGLQAERPHRHDLQQAGVRRPARLVFHPGGVLQRAHEAEAPFPRRVRELLLRPQPPARLRVVRRPPRKGARRGRPD